MSGNGDDNVEEVLSRGQKEKEALKEAQRLSRKMWEEKKAKVKAHKKKIAGKPVPPPSFKGKGGLNCWIRYTNSGARYVTCGTYHGKGPTPPPAKFTPLITPHAFVSKVGKSSYHDLTAGQKREYHRLAMANTRAEARENIEENTEEYKKFLVEKKEDLAEERREKEIFKKEKKEEAKIQRVYERKPAIAKTEKDIEKYFKIFYDNQMKKVKSEKAHVKRAEKKKEQIDAAFERFDKKTDQEKELRAIDEMMEFMGYSGQFGKKFDYHNQHKFKRMREGETKRDMDKEVFETPWGRKYTLGEIAGVSDRKDKNLKTGTNMTMFVAYGLGDVSRKNVKSNIKKMISNAYDNVYNKLKKQKVKMRVKAETEEEKLDADKQGYIIKDVPYTAKYKPDSSELRKHFEDGLTDRFNISPFGNKKKENMTQGETKTRENFITGLREKARRNLEEEEAQDYKDKLEKITFDIQHDKDKEIKRVRDTYINKVQRAKSSLNDARRLAEENGLPKIWIKHNIVLEFDKEGNPAGIDAIKQMVDRVGNSYDRLQKLKDDLDEIEERIQTSQKYLKKKSYKLPSVDEIQKDVDDARSRLTKGSRFTKAYTKDLYSSIENAEKYIKKSKKEDLRVEKLLRRQARELGIPYRKSKKKDSGSNIDEIMGHIKKKGGINIKIEEVDE